MKYTAIALMSVAGAVKVEDAPNYTMWYVDGFRGWHDGFAKAFYKTGNVSIDDECLN